MIADDKVTPLPTLLERLGRRIDQAWQRAQNGEGEWVEGSLELAQALAEGRGRFSANKAFGDWLIANKHDHVGHQDRAALINFAGDLTLARDVLIKTTRRSYQHIWTEEQGRFTHVSKTDKPKRGRPKGQRRSRNPPAVEQAVASLVLDHGRTYEQAAAELGLNSVQPVKTSKAREEGRRESFTELLGAAAAENFLEKGKLRIEDAIRIHTARLNKQFEQRVNEEVRRRIDAADDSTRASNKQLRKDNLYLTGIVNQRGVFTETQYKQMLMLCHPDSSASPQLKAELLQVLIQNKMRLVKQ